MSIDTKLIDGSGQKYHAKVNKYKALKVYVSPPELPASGSLNTYNFYKSEFTAMNVNGSVTPVEWILGASVYPSVDIIITHISILIADGSVSHGKFGAIAALTNGFDLRVVQEGVDTYLYQNIKTTGQMLIASGMFSPYGDGASAYIIPNFLGTSDGVIVRMDIKDFFPGIQGGIRLGRSSKNKIVATVKDNLSTLDDFKMTFFGYTQIELPESGDVI